ncbi:hypothetical protein [Pseudobacter ginsenosidimutans]|uniref:DUF4890 domain-containing protein n=1 Tax=Pseudobacter ginsenosidimutans TaxID=661488 RepID=A0A4Q7MXL8_9BACT|nr:hypothetical protein [Pseudobacter ginsenosidimutans]QEC41375.1 hypothetical protein FSB84_06575 [Pseudobacter ginsenosidimutans]RZS71850.1 hypothetical protein EV199_3763 [Pseudobacter ginsenosidimutans]
MKRIFLLLAVVMLTGTIAVKAQGGGMQRRSVEENVKMVMEKLADLKLDKDQTVKTDTAFAHYFKDRDKMFEEMRSNNGDRSQMREKMTSLANDRDEKLKKIFTEAQYKKWKDEIEPSMRPQRGGGPGGPGGGRQRP